MMPYYGWNLGWFGIAGMSFMMVFWVAIVIALVVIGFRYASRREGGTPLDTLKQRFAKGEITREQYEEGRKLLTS